MADIGFDPGGGGMPGGDGGPPPVTETQENAGANQASNPSPPEPVIPVPAYSPPPRNFAGYPSGGSGYRAPAAPAAPADPAQAAYDAIPQAYRNILEDLEHTWQLYGGYAAAVSKQNLVDMAKQHVVSMSDFGKFMWSSGGLSDDVKKQNPWLGVGLSQGEYVKSTNAYLTQWMRLTGKQADISGIGTGAVPADAKGDARTFIWNALQTGATPQDFSDIVTQDQNVRDTYKWLQHGIDYQQFQVKKQDMALAFGGVPTDDQAVLQLTYWQRFTDGFGENQAVHANEQGAQGQAQEALAQGATGVSGATTR